MAKPKKKYKSTRLSAARVKEMVRQNYEPGRHDKCLMSVYRNVVSKQLGISERTYWRYLKTETDPPTNTINGEQEEDERQMRLWAEE